ncbi:uncharacterized protein EI90DRAFT_658901 [Cantharellus anzutake]|uniref:uncharacterized protein n=1 Tax=Cantharellus anzutake TaxID=1750568 RepID=UPI0019053BC3|nr:uncharacterized protein EI90DRAFT_658901 [Cantharellus anzutake]KAF8312569.1 hypothetical protein EI90DRAFT_658901 [Cantharellus anzutake]
MPTSPSALEPLSNPPPAIKGSKQEDTYDRRTPEPKSKSIPSASSSNAVALPGSPSRVKDLSRLFESIDIPVHGISHSPARSGVSGPAPGTPAKHRMLRRAVTLSEAVPSPVTSMNSPGRPSTHPSLNSSPSRPLGLPGTVSLPNISLRIDENPTLPSIRPSVPPSNDTGSASAEALPPPTRPSVRTYSASRSFLAPIRLSSNTNDEENQPQSQPQPFTLDPESQELFHESYAEMRKRLRVDASSDDGIDEGLMGPLDLKSISELRDKGENRRFLDEMGYLLEGMNPEMTVSVKRLSVIKLLDNMCSLEFVRRAASADAIGSAWTILRKSNDAGDKILDVCLVIFAALVAREARPTDLLASESDVGEHLGMVVQWPHDVDPFGFFVGNGRSEDARLLKIGKPERVLIQQLRSFVRKGKLLSEDSYITIRQLASQALFKMRSHHVAVFPYIIASLKLELPLLTSRVDGYTKGLELLPSTSFNTPSLEHVDNCLCVLESKLLEFQSVSETEIIQSDLLSVQKEFVEGLPATLLVCQILSLEEREDFFDGTHLMISCLRTLVNFMELGFNWRTPILSNNLTVPACLRIISSYAAKSTAVGQDDDAANKLDILCMALALITSLVQGGGNGPELISSSLVDPECALARSCLRGCRCRARISGLQCVVNLYVDQTKESAELGSAEANFLKGHLAVLLALLCSNDGTGSFEKIIDLLPGGSRPSKLQSWIDAVTEFTFLYADLTTRFAKAIQASHLEHTPEEGVDTEDDEQPSSSSKLDQATYSTNSLLRMQRESQGQMKGVELARSVLHTLQQFQMAT